MNKIKYVVDSNAFKGVPGTPLAYWAGDVVHSIYNSHKTLGETADIRHGMSTGKNELFVRSWFEVEWTKINTSLTNRYESLNMRERYVPYNKGGEFRRWYGNIEYVLWYDEEGQMRMAECSGHRHDGKERYFQAGITWSFISSGSFGVRFAPPGFAFDVAGSSLFVNEKNLDLVLGVLCSKVGMYFMSIQNPTLNFQVGNLKNIPLIENDNPKIAEYVEENVALSKQDWDSYETSWGFKKHPLI